MEREREGEVVRYSYFDGGVIPTVKLLFPASLVPRPHPPKNSGTGMALFVNVWKLPTVLLSM